SVEGHAEEARLDAVVPRRRGLQEVPRRGHQAHRGHHRGDRPQEVAIGHRDSSSDRTLSPKVMRGPLVDRLLSAAVLALGIAVSVIAARMPASGGYARIGPDAMPVIVGIGLVLIGIWLLAESFTGGWRNRAPDDPAARGEHAFHG